MARTSDRDLRGDEYIDSRDVIARLRALESDRDSAIEEAGEDGAETWTTASGDTVSVGWDEEQEEEYQALRELDEYAPGDDWAHGCTMIREDIFEDYAREFAKDIGALKDCDHWPATCIDWARAAEELQADYTSVEFGGWSYWVR